MVLMDDPKQLEQIGIGHNGQSMVAELHLPYPPSANRLWRRSGRRIHKGAEYANWLVDAGFTAIKQRQPGIVGKYKISINAVRPDKRRRDLDNIIKAISDLVKSVGIIDDDCDCEQISARWVTTGEGVYVRVEPAGVE